jgi:hypothetical protein
MRGSDSDLSARPPERLIAVLLVATLVLPLLALFGVTEVGGFRMFTRFVEYRVALFTEMPGGPPRRMAAERLMPHLGRDARRVVGFAYDFVPGEAAATLIEGGLFDLALIGCKLDPTATRAIAVFERRLPSGQPLPGRAYEARCNR